METNSELIAELAKDPLYQLSTAGQEQFHTNMFYWLFKNRPDSTQAVAGWFGVCQNNGGSELGLTRRA